MFLALLWLLSPWFLWQLLPEDTTFKAVLKSDSRIPGLVPGLQLVEPLLDASAQLGVARDSDGRTTFIIRPTVTGYFLLRRELESAGWPTSWYGPWLMAQQHEDRQRPSFWSAVLAAGKAGLGLPAGRQGTRTSYNPLFIAEGRLPGLAKPVRAVAIAVGQEWRVSVHEADITDQPGTVVDRPPQPVRADTAELAVTGATLAGLPASLKNTWNERLRNKLGLTKTKPDFISELTQYQRVQLAIGPPGARLTVFDAPDRWKAAVSGWVEDEERQWRIQKRSFRLPDGTFGAEYVPGPRQAIFTPSTVHSNCSEATVQERHFWLCGGDHNLFTSAEDLIATATPPTAFEVTLGTNLLPAIADKKLLAATVAVTDGETLVRLLWESKR